MSYMNTLLFGIYPYVALAVCVIGCIVRFDFEPYTWRAQSSQIFRRKNMRLASNLFHVGVLFILFGHLVGLLTPESIYHHFISTPAKQVLAMVSGGFFGVVMLVGLTMLLARRLTDERVRANTSNMDFVVLIMLYAQLLLGLASIFVSAGHLDGSVMVLLANWAQCIVTFQLAEAVASIAPVHVIYKLHVFLGMTLVLIVPFTRLVHVISAPVWYLGRSYQVVRQKG